MKLCKKKIKSETCPKKRYFFLAVFFSSWQSWVDKCMICRRGWTKSFFFLKRCQVTKQQIENSMLHSTILFLNLLWESRKLSNLTLSFKLYTLLFFFFYTFEKRDIYSQASFKTPFFNSFFSLSLFSLFFSYRLLFCKKKNKMVALKQFTRSLSSYGLFTIVAASNLWTGVNAQDDGSGTSIFLLFRIFNDSIY